MNETETSGMKILVVEDDDDLLRALQIRLRAAGYEVAVAQDVVQATMAARRMKPDLILVDLGLPGGDGVMLIERLKPLVPLAKIVVLTAQDPAEYIQKALDAGAVAYLQKPCKAETLLDTLEDALNAQEMLG